MSSSPETAAQKQSVLGPTLRFKGELAADEDLVIHGQIDGTIGPTPRVTIGPKARVQANIRAKHIVIEGSVDGDLHGEASVVVKETATVNGNIQSPAVSIVEGAKFNGNVAMGTREAASSVSAGTDRAAKTGTAD